jgi:hypothetical protein
MAGVDRPAKGVYVAAASVLVFMVVPPTSPGEVNAIWYLRQNDSVISVLVLFALVGDDVLVAERNERP